MIVQAIAFLRWRLVFVVYAAFASFLLLVPNPLRILGLSRYSDALVGDRGQHALLFAGLAFLCVACRWPVSRKAITLLLVVYAVGTEGLQALIPPRTPEWADVAENLAGIAVGLAFYAVLSRVVGNRSAAA